MKVFNPPNFETHRWIRGGHLQTLFAVRRAGAVNRTPTSLQLELDDGDTLVLHENSPPDWKPGDPSLLLIHGLSGCHLSPYMIRLSNLFYELGVRVFRLDSRGCGAGSHLASQLSHAGRSEDVISALEFIAQRTDSGPISVAGISLGGNQLLLAAGRLGGSAKTQRPSWYSRLKRIAAVCPPIDLVSCSRNMQRLMLRPYNAYFIRSLLRNAPKRVTERADFQEAMALGQPRTMWELDNRITAPLSGFGDAETYYRQCSARQVTSDIVLPTLVIAAANDPMIPIRCFQGDLSIWSATTQLLVPDGGGHVGFQQRTGVNWMDLVLKSWFTEDAGGLGKQAMVA